MARPTSSKRRKLDGFFSPKAATPAPRPVKQPSKSASTSAPVVIDLDAPPPRSIADVLKPQAAPMPSAKPAAPSLPPLTLATPALVAQHSPCTLLLNVLPAELAAELYLHTMDVESPSWTSNKCVSLPGCCSDA